ncbi:regulator protein [Streptomyces sp. A244]|uniref:AfsR/SARP family transcriptional regulator n=1 Tax=Streptomyces TaxID=1883 RepID=UPI000D1BA619|nr:AfsR/SARP family transcriptional regulator [Streptomyces sp. A244]PTH90240.1 regulator protein [Streptomyces sp. A244]
MRFRVLGPVRMGAEGQETALEGTKPRALLAALVLARGTVVPDTRLIALLWGDDAPATVAAQVYTYVSRLRRQLGPDVELVRRRPGYALHTGQSFVDLYEFERLARLGQDDFRAGRYAPAAERLRSALALWSGSALTDTTRFLREAAEPGLHEARMAALECRIDADLALGEHLGAVAELTDLVAHYPLRERFRAQLMTALYRSERQADALAVFDRGRRLLDEKLGVSPGRALTLTHQAVLSGELAFRGASSAFAPRPVPATGP